MKVGSIVPLFRSIVTLQLRKNSISLRKLQINIPPFQQLDGENAAAKLLDLPPFCARQYTQYDMTRNIISLGKAAALDPRKELRSLHSCSGQAVLKDSSSGFNMYREPAYSPALSIADQHPGLLNMLRSPIFALGTLGVGNRPTAGLHRTIGISATPPSLWPGCELQKYLL